MTITNQYYTHSSGKPVNLSRGASQILRSEFDAIASAFTKVDTALGAASSAADFKLIYQGSSAADPTQRYNGTQLQDGDLYFNSVSKVFKSFSGGAWYAIPTSSSVMTKDGGTFLGPIGGTTATFSSTVTAAGFVGEGAGLTGLKSTQIISALGYTPLDRAGGSMTGQLTGTSAVYNSTVTASDFIITSDERGKKKWKPLDDDIIDRIAAIKRVGTYEDKKTGRRKAGIGAQSLRELMPEAVHEGALGRLGVDYGPAALALVAKLSKRVIALEKKIAKLEKK